MNGSILLIPSIRRNGGLGHLVRMMRLALSWKGKASIFLEPGNPIHWNEEEIRCFFPAFLWDRFLERNPESHHWDWVIFDRRSTSLKEYRRLQFGASTLGLDEGGEARPLFMFLVDTFPRIKKMDEPNRKEPRFVPMIDLHPADAQKKGVSQDDFSRVLLPIDSQCVSQTSPLTGKSSPKRGTFLLAFGGEDPHRLSERTFDALVAGGVQPKDIDVLIGPARPYPFIKPCGEILSGCWNAWRYFSRYRWVITSFGLTPYEAILEGAIPLLVNPTQYHERLSEMAGFYSLGVKRVSHRRFRFALERPEAVLPLWVLTQSQEREKSLALGVEQSSAQGRNGCHGKDKGMGQELETGQRFEWPQGLQTEHRTEEPSFAEFLSSIRADIPPRCPLCGEQDHRATFRLSDRTFFRCLQCKTEYRVYFGKLRKEYTAKYFFEEYHLQYGKTYLEDFSQIKEQGKKRLDFLKECISTEAWASKTHSGKQGSGSPGTGNKKKGNKEVFKGKTILDVGCAMGPFLDAAREVGMVPYGIDISEEAIQYVRNTLGIPASVADIETFYSSVAFDVLSFDVISLWYVIEHLPRVGHVLERIRNMLREGGWLIFSTPNGRGISSLRNPKSFREQNPVDHVTIWNVTQAKKVLGKFGFKVQAIRTPSHHPERFPSLVRTLMGSKACSALETVLHIGDTFEVYAQKIDHDSRCRASAAPCS